METLKFRHHLVKEVLEGCKTATWRLFDDKDLETGDRIEFVDYDDGEKFAEAEITEVKEKKLGEINDADFEGHERYRSKEDMLNHYKEYYGDRVTYDTIIKMIKFKLIS